MAPTRTTDGGHATRASSPPVPVIPSWPLLYWQLDDMPPRTSRAFHRAGGNRTRQLQLQCEWAFAGGACPASAAVPALPASWTPPARRPQRGSSMLFFAPGLGHLSNCIMVTELARFLAERLGKRLVVPLCASVENTEQACRPGSQRPDGAERQLMVNLTAIFTRHSLGRCRHSSQHAAVALDLRDALAPEAASPPTPRALRSTSSGARRNTGAAAPASRGRLLDLACVAPTAAICALFFGQDAQYAGVALRRFVAFDLAWFTAAWFAFSASRPSTAAESAGPRHETWSEMLARQDAGEACTQPVDCSCDQPLSVRLHGWDRNESCRTKAPEAFAHGRGGEAASTSASPIPARAMPAAALPPPCLRNCMGVSVLDATRGHVYVPDLFDRAGMLHQGRLASSPCAPLDLAARPAQQAHALHAAVSPAPPGRFLCVHWRAGDFLSPTPLSRFRGKSNLELHDMLANGTAMGAAAARAARTVGARHVLVLTNARLDRVAAFQQAIEWEATQLPSPLALTARVCSDAPPDAEKRVCAKAAGLVLSTDSSFSLDILRLAAPGTPHTFVARCLTAKGWRRAYRNGTLLHGPRIPCS